MQNTCSFYFLRIKRSYLQIPENAWKFFLNKFTFNTVTFQVFFQGFYLDFKLLLLLHFKFPKPCIFQNNSFSHPFMVAGLGIHDNRLDERLWYYWYFTHFQGVLRLYEGHLGDLYARWRSKGVDITRRLTQW